MALVAEGLTSKEIARSLSLSPSTFDSHISAAVRLLGCTTRAQAVRALRGQQGIERDGVSLEKHRAEHAQRQLHAVLPPLGGRLNDDPPAVRLGRIAVIALLSIALGAAMIATIVGTVALLQR